MVDSVICIVVLEVVGALLNDILKHWLFILWHRICAYFRSQSRNQSLAFDSLNVWHSKNLLTTHMTATPQVIKTATIPTAAIPTIAIPTVTISIGGTKVHVMNKLYEVFLL